MVNRTLYIFQSWVSLIIHSAMVGINLYLGWASVEALWMTGHLIIFYELFDLSIGWEGYWKKDRLMLFHHGATFAAGWVMLTYLGSDDMQTVAAVRDTMYWAMLSEVTTVFNAIRIITGRCGKIISFGTRGLFAIMFCGLRGAQTVGMCFEIYRHWNGMFVYWIIGFWMLFTAMNLFWMKAIIVTFVNKTRKMRVE